MQHKRERVRNGTIPFLIRRKKKHTSEGKLNEEPEHMKLKNYFEHLIARLSIPCHLSNQNAKFHSRAYK